MLISVLIFSVLTLMFVGAAVSLAPSGVARSAADSSLASADRAARSGVDWARSRISQDPNWNASTSQTFTAPGLFVTEGDGQVTGWVAEGKGWSRFRIRFNYQDGPSNNGPNSDALNDPGTAWTDFSYVSCNNILGASDKTAPIAQNGTSTTSTSPWANTQLTVPAGTMLLSVEGSHGRSVSMSSGQPSTYVGGYHKRTVQTVVKLGVNQPITTAAIMAAGDLLLNALSPTTLATNNGQMARLRTKSNLSVNGGVSSSQAELRHAGTQSVSGPVSSGVTIASEDTTGFFKIPATKVRTPSSPATLQAGTWVVTSTGQVIYYNMEYKDWATASPAPTGTPTSLPSGMALSGPHATGPKFRITLTKDVQVNPSGSLTGIALVPDGGAPQSGAYGGLPAASPSASPSGSASPAMTTSTMLGYYFSSPYSSKLALDSSTLAAWTALANNSPGATLSSASVAGSTIPTGGFATTAVTYRRYSISGGSFWVPNSLPAPPTKAYVWKTSDVTNMVTSAPTGQFTALQAATQAAVGPSPSPSASPSASPTPPPGPAGILKPKDLELTLQGGTKGLVFANDGDITIGAQVVGNGSAFTSKANIALIGTSTDLNSAPGTQLGLNLYAQGNITIDAFELDASGGTFHKIDLNGVIYAWHNIDIMASNGSKSAPFKLKGTIVAYGGDPAGSPSPGTAKASINANSIDITYDPSYVAGLMQGGPYTLEVLSWHQF